jgi:coenzyme F420-0:L-glutamate ligase/coenzyme F420-1:gamma-L-glutamate ligase
VTAPVSILPVEGIPEVESGADLAGLISDSAPDLRDGDVLIVTHKVVAKAEGRLVDLSTVTPSPLACNFATDAGKDPRHVEVVLRESRRIVRMRQGVLIAETQHGLVCANAGVDASNVPGEETVCLLPADPDASAARLRADLKARRGVDVALIISDSFGRPWRNGIVNVAIGLAGMDPFADYRGEHDPHGYLLVASRMAVADALAAAAELVMGKLDRVPVALIRGYAWQPAEMSARDLIMDPERDLFR